VIVALSNRHDSTDIEPSPSQQVVRQNDGGWVLDMLAIGWGEFSELRAFCCI